MSKRIRWTKEKITQKLKEYQLQGIKMTSRNIQRVDSSLYNACFGHFGSLSKAMASAGVDYNTKTPNKITIKGDTKFIEITKRDKSKVTVEVDSTLNIPSSVWISCGYPKVKIHSEDVMLHSYVYGAVKDGYFIDHIDRDVMNSKRNNLREISRIQNNQNRSAKGYTFDKESEQYQARIMTNGVSKSLGYFETPEEARIAYLQAKLEYHGFECSPITIVELKEAITKGE